MKNTIRSIFTFAITIALFVGLYFYAERVSSRECGINPSKSVPCFDGLEYLLVGFLVIIVGLIIATVFASWAKKHGERWGKPLLNSYTVIWAILGVGLLFLMQG